MFLGGHGVYPLSQDIATC